MSLFNASLPRFSTQQLFSLLTSCLPPRSHGMSVCWSFVVCFCLYRMRLLSGHHVLVHSDNTCIITKCLCPLPLSPSHKLPVTSWSSIHLLSLNTHPANTDLLSRGSPLVREWRLHPGEVEQIWSRFGRATFDLFTSMENVICSSLYGMGAWCLDQMFPPVALIHNHTVSCAYRWIRYDPDPHVGPRKHGVQGSFFF